MALSWMALSASPSLVLLASPKNFLYRLLLFVFIFLFNFFNCCCSRISPRMSANKRLGKHKEKGSNRPRSETIARVCLTFLSPNLRENKNKIEVNAQYSSSR